MSRGFKKKKKKPNQSRGGGRGAGWWWWWWRGEISPHLHELKVLLIAGASFKYDPIKRFQSGIHIKLKVTGGDGDGGCS